MTYFLLTKSGHEFEIDEKQKLALEKVMTGEKQFFKLYDLMLNTGSIDGVYDQPKPRRGMYYCSYGQWHDQGVPCGCHESQWQRQNQAVDASRQVEAGEQCRGQYSIQHEINMIAFHDHPQDWKKYVGNKKWREETRQKLHEAEALWCDIKAKECHCEANYKPSYGRHNYA